VLYVALANPHVPPFTHLTVAHSQGLEPLRYQWFKDDRKLSMATADSPNLIIAETSPIDVGSYYCQVGVVVVRTSSQLRSH
jgi:hypothetical protein